MAQSMIDYINTEYKENQQRFIKQVEPLTKFFEAGYEASLRKDEERKVLNQQIADYDIRLKSIGGMYDKENPASPKAQYETRLAEYERENEPTEITTTKTNGFEEKVTKSKKGDILKTETIIDETDKDTKERKITLVHRKTGETVSAYRIGGKLISVKTGKEINPNNYREKATSTGSGKQSLQDKAEQAGYGEYWDTSKETDKERRFADSEMRFKKVAEKQKELEEYKALKSINFAEPVDGAIAEKIGKSWTGATTETSKKRLKDFESGKPIKKGGEIYVKIDDTVYLFKETDDYTALQLATKFSKEYPEKIKEIEKEISELKGNKKEDTIKKRKAGESIADYMKRINK